MSLKPSVNDISSQALLLFKISRYSYIYILNFISHIKVFFRKENKMLEELYNAFCFKMLFFD